MEACACGRVGFGATSGMGRCMMGASGFGTCRRTSSAGWDGDGLGVSCGMASEGTRMGGAGAGAGEGVAVEFAAEEDESSLELLSDAEGSGRCSIFALLQRGHTQSRDLMTSIRCYNGALETAENETHSAARRLRSAVGYSRAPTPTAAVPFRGKKPWRPMIARVDTVRTRGDT